MDVSVLGCGAAFPRPGGACSGFLVRGGGTTVWMDAGNGTFSRLQELVAFTQVDALILSHVHPDHIADVIPFMYALGFDEEFSGTIPVWAPPDVPEALRGLLGEMSRRVFESVFSFAAVDGPIEVGPLRFDPFRTVHPVETYGFRVSGDGGTLVYTADTAEFPELAESCAGADVLIAEATFVRPYEAEGGIHLWADEAGRLASKAEAERLVLTHVWGTTPLEVAVQQASETFTGPLEAAAEGATYTL